MRRSLEFIKVGKFSLYKIPLRGLSEGTHNYDYLLDNQFFKSINDDNSDLNRGNVNVDLVVKKKSNLFELNFNLNGHVSVPCDRCLDDLTIEITTQNRLIVKFGKEYAEESDEIVIIPEDDGEINIAWFLYEFVSLNVPMKRVHPQGQCNRMMSSKLNKHRAQAKSDDDRDEIEEEDIQEDNSMNETDSRWDSLKDLSFD